MATFVEFREAGNGVGRELLPTLEKECPRKSDCIIEVMPVAAVVGLSREDVDILMRSVLAPLRSFRFWADEKDRKWVLERLKIEQIYDEAALEKFAKSGRGKRLRISCGLTPEIRENKVDLECRILNMGIEIAAAEKSFHQPEYIKRKIEEAARADSERKRQVESSILWTGVWRKAVWVGGIASCLLLLGALILLIAKKIRHKKALATLPAAKSEFESLFKGGKFVAADALLKKVLNEVPEDVELQSYQTRLEILTCNNPRLAEEAWVKARWAETMINENKVHEVLPGISEMKALAPHSKELTAICTKLEKIERDEKRERELLPKLDEARVLAGRGRINDAKAVVDGVLREVPGFKKADELAAKLKISADDALRFLEDGKNALLRGGFGEAAVLFEKASGKDNSLEEASALMAGLRRCNLRRGAILLPEGGQKPVKIYTSDIITFGREDADIEMIDQRVSRRHALIKNAGNEILLEDANSKNGVTVNGEKIFSRVLNDGDTFNIAGACEFRCRLHSTGGRLAAAVIESDSISAVLLTARIPIRLCAQELKNASPEDELVFVKGEGRSAIIGISSSGWELIQPGRRFKISQIVFSVEEIT